MQNSDFWGRITSIYVSQLSSVVFAYTTAHFGPEFQVCTGPRQNLSFFAWKTATLAHELLVSMGPSPHLWFLHAKQRLLDPNNKSLWVPDITCRFVNAKQRDYHQNNLSLWVPTLICGFCMQNSDFWSRITSIYVSQLSSVVFAYTTAHFGPEFQVCTGPRQNLSFFAWKTATLAHELLVSMGPSPHLWFLHAKQRLLDPNNKSLWVPDITCRFVNAKQRD